MPWLLWSVTRSSKTLAQGLTQHTAAAGSAAKLSWVASQRTWLGGKKNIFVDGRVLGGKANR